MTLLVRQAPACVERLLELGHGLRPPGDQLSTTLEAAHSHRRVLHVQDRTGGALVEALERRVLQAPGPALPQGGLALQLWMEAGRCVGLQMLLGGTLGWIRAGAVVLACGGGGHLFAHPHTTNPYQSTRRRGGDGLAGGRRKRDLEFVQFHPPP